MTEGTTRAATGLLGLAVGVYVVSKAVGKSLKVKGKIKSNGGLNK